MLISAWTPRFGSAVRFEGDESILGDLDHQAVLDLLRREGFVLFDERIGLADFEAFAARFGPVLWRSRPVPNTRDAFELHSEAAWTPFPPEVLWFHCQRPAARNGQTTVCDGRELWRRMTPRMQDFFRREPIQINRLWPHGSWQKSFGTDSFEEAAAKFEEAPGAEVTLLDDGGLRYRYTHSAVSASLTGEETFANSLLFALPRPHTYGLCRADGGELPAGLVRELAELAESLTLEIDWAPGRVAVLDNRRVMHGRRSYDDERRSVKAFHTRLA